MGFVLPGSTFGITVGTILIGVPEQCLFLESEDASSRDGRFMDTLDGVPPSWKPQTQLVNEFHELVLHALQLPLHVMEHVAFLPLVSQTHP